MIWSSGVFECWNVWQPKLWPLTKSAASCSLVFVSHNKVTQMSTKEITEWISVREVHPCRVAECRVLTNPTVFASCGHSALHHQASHLKGVPGVTLQPIGSYLRGDPITTLGDYVRPSTSMDRIWNSGILPKKMSYLESSCQKRAENQNKLYIHTLIYMYIYIYIYTYIYICIYILNAFWNHQPAFATSQLSLLWTFPGPWPPWWQCSSWDLLQIPGIRPKVGGPRSFKILVPGNIWLAIYPLVISYIAIEAMAQSK